jgi:hypothetical protein
LEVPSYADLKEVIGVRKDELRPIQESTLDSTQFESSNSHTDSQPHERSSLLKERGRTEIEYSKWAIDYNELELKEEIGRGAFGIVYFAKWRKSRVVVKKLWNRRLSHSEIASFKRETDIIMCVFSFSL